MKVVSPEYTKLNRKKEWCSMDGDSDIVLVAYPEHAALIIQEFHNLQCSHGFITLRAGFEMSPLCLGSEAGLSRFAYFCAIPSCCHMITP